MIGETASYNTYSNMSDSTNKRRKIYVNHPQDISKPTCLIYDPGHLSDNFKVLRDFFSNYDKSRPTEDRGNDLANRLF